MLSLTLLLAFIDNEDDRKIFAAFYEKHKQYSLNLAYSYLHNRSMAEDAVQEAFKYLVEHPWRILDYEESEATWFLSELIRDYSMNLLRKENRFQKVSLTALDTAIGEEALMHSLENAHIPDIIEAVYRLDEVDRVILRLFYEYGYKTKEIARMLKLSDANVRKRLQRSRAKLKTLLESEKVAVYE